MPRKLKIHLIAGLALARLAAAQAGAPAIPPEVQRVLDTVGRYPADVPLLVVQRLATFQFQKLDAQLQKRIQSTSPLGGIDMIARKSRPLEASFRAARRQLLSPLVQQPSWTPLASPGPI